MAKLIEEHKKEKEALQGMIEQLKNMTPEWEQLLSTAGISKYEFEIIL